MLTKAQRAMLAAIHEKPMMQRKANRTAKVLVEMKLAAWKHRGDDVSLLVPTRYGRDCASRMVKGRNAKLSSRAIGDSLDEFMARTGVKR